MKPRLPVRRAIIERKTYEAPAEGRFGKVRLDFNENTAGCSPAVVRELARLSPKLIAMYPEYEPSVRELARYFGVRPSELLLANGADDAIRAFFDTFVEQGDPVLLCEPTFPMYRFYAEIFGARIRVCRYDSDMNLPLAPVLAALRERPRVLFIANPNNPTGTLLSRRDVETLLKAATHTPVVIDEAYVEFSGVTMLPLIRRYPQLFVVRTFSKATGLAALRLGAILARADSLAYLRRAMPPFPVNVAALVAARAVIRDKRTMQRYIREAIRLRGWLGEQLRALGIVVHPSAGNFLLADFGPSGPHLFRRLASRGFLLRDRKGDLGPGFVRISIGTEPEMRRLVREIRRLRRNRHA
jgi:histidinol-phosphate aminotransferase